MTFHPTQELEGKKALDFAERYLKKIDLNPQTWQISYEDPSTGDLWIMDYPQSEAQGGGSPRLRKVQR
ncbi:MAG: hypothetical protein JO300_04980 [Silvibacterium sp.]|nr:hypothetical protein [Silvibacterium sp.]